MHSLYRSSTRGPEDDSVESKHTIVVFDGTSPTFYFTNTSGWNTSSSNAFEPKRDEVRGNLRRPQNEELRVTK